MEKIRLSKLMSEQGICSRREADRFIELGWVFVDASWGAGGVAQCDAVRGQGACWTVVREKFRFMLFGVYPFEQQWRPAVAVVLLCALLVVSALRVFWNK